MMRFGRIALTMAALAALTVTLVAQPPAGGGQGKAGAKGKAGPGGRGGFGAPQPPRQAAPIDLTGTWVSLVTEDWLYRMRTPDKGDVASVPLSGAGRQAANAWDPAADEASGQTCKAYGAAGLMRLPTRLQIDWVDDNTLRVRTDTGTQTRLFHFDGEASGAPSLQGFSKATWEGVGGGGRGRGAFGVPAGATGDPNAPGGRAAAAPVRPGALKVVTTNLSGGYLRKNGVPYSPQTTLTEYYDVLHQPNGDLYLLISTIVDDPVNLSQLFRTSTHFKKEADNSKFKPTPCSAR